MKHISLGIGRIIFGMAGLTAIIFQLFTSIHSGRNIVNFFSFFTIESNILAVVLLLVLGVFSFMKKELEWTSFIRGAITLYMTITGIIYVLLLSGNEVALQTTIPWVNIILHYLLPLIVLADWLIFPPSTYISFKRATWWLAFPVVYLVYSLVRGAYTNWYPYPFINPVDNGWPTVVVMCLFIAIGSIVGAGLVAIRTSTHKPQRAM